MKKIERLLKHDYENHYMPLLWLHGESEEAMRNYIRQIKSAGIQSFCIEARPHPDFLGNQWWSDLSIIIDECEKQDMAMWLFDDKHFPTGYAAGQVEAEAKELQKLFLKMDFLDFSGSKKNAGIILDWMAYNGRPYIMSVGIEEDVNKKELNKDEYPSKILGVVAAKKTDFKKIDESTLIDLTENIKDNVLYWDIPEGEWTFFFFVLTQFGGEEATEGYLNPLLQEATDVLLDTVYKPHYEHFQDKFGNVIQGFFSDEPRFGNVKGFDASIGRKEMQLPWTESFLQDFADYMKLDSKAVKRKLPLLFIGDSKEAFYLRYQYMDFVSGLYSRNFSGRIGDWCRERNIKYIGHVLEDNNAHARLGYGAGHFYRSMAGQDMSGIDIVFHQLMPQMNNSYNRGFTGSGWDGEFFHYALAKMGASLGYLDARKQGRNLVELFGCYGWAEGLKLMKWISDHMLSRGINYFMPHAYSVKPDPDIDCPPHFYAWGNNPQYPYMHKLTNYVNRVSTLISDGKHLCSVALLYHGEAEWAGDYMLVQKPARELLEHQVEFDIVSMDMLMTAGTENHKLEINGSAYQIVIVPYAERIPCKLAKALILLAQNGIKVIFAGDLPMEILDGEESYLEKLLFCSERSSLSGLADHVKQNDADWLHVKGKFPYLRYFHYKHDDGECYILFNENTYQDIEFQWEHGKNELSVYDAYENKIRKAEVREGTTKVALARAELMIFLEGSQETAVPVIAQDYMCSELKGWKIRFKDCCGKSGFPQQIWAEEPLVLGVGDAFKDFSGTVIYEKELDRFAAGGILEIEDASEVVSIFINDKYCGTKISNPYRFELPEDFADTETILRIEVVNTLGRSRRDYLSQFILEEPIGITGSIKLFCRKEGLLHRGS